MDPLHHTDQNHMALDHHMDQNHLMDHLLRMGQNRRMDRNPHMDRGPMDQNHHLMGPDMAPTPTLDIENEGPIETRTKML